MHSFGVRLSVSPSIHPSIRSIRPFVRWSVRLSVCLFIPQIVRLPIHIHPSLRLLMMSVCLNLYVSTTIEHVTDDLPQGKQWVLVSRDPQCWGRGETKLTSCFSRGQSLSVLLYFGTQKWKKKRKWVAWGAFLPVREAVKPSCTTETTRWWSFPSQLTKIKLTVLKLLCLLIILNSGFDLKRNSVFCCK